MTFVLSFLINNKFPIKEKILKLLLLLCSVSVSFTIALTILKFSLTELGELFHFEELS